MNQFGAQKFSLKKPFMILMFIGMGIRSVSADMKKILSAIYRIGAYRYRPIWKKAYWLYPDNLQKLFWRKCTYVGVCNILNSRFVFFEHSGRGKATVWHHFYPATRSFCLERSCFFRFRCWLETLLFADDDSTVTRAQ